MDLLLMTPNQMAAENRKLGGGYEVRRNISITLDRIKFTTMAPKYTPHGEDPLPKIIDLVKLLWKYAQ